MNRFKVVGIVTAKFEIKFSAYSQEAAEKMFKENVQLRLEKEGCSDFEFQINSITVTPPTPRQSRE